MAKRTTRRPNVVSRLGSDNWHSSATEKDPPRSRRSRALTQLDVTMRAISVFL